MSETTKQISLQLSPDVLLKIERYCSIHFNESLQEKLIQVSDEFIKKILDQIKAAEETFKKDYLEIGG